MKNQQVESIKEYYNFKIDSTRKARESYLEVCENAPYSPGLYETQKAVLEQYDCWIDELIDQRETALDLVHITPKTTEADADALAQLVDNLRYEVDNESDPIIWGGEVYYPTPYRQATEGGDEMPF